MPIVDDVDSRIIYSSGWQTSSGISGQREGTSHFSNTPDATITVNFRGTGIRVRGTNPGTHSGQRLSARILLNGAEVRTIDLRGHSSAFYDEHFYDSPRLETTRDHQLVIINTSSGVPFHLDYLDVDGEIIGSQPATSRPPTPTPNRPSSPPAPTSPNPPEVSTHIVTRVVTAVDTQRPSESSDSPPEASVTVGPVRSVAGSLEESGSLSSFISLPLARPTDNSAVTITSIEVRTSISVLVPGDTGITGGIGTNAAGTRKRLDVGAIAGIIIGSIALLVLVGALLALYYRRRRRQREGKGKDAEKVSMYQAGGGLNTSDPFFKVTPFDAGSVLPVVDRKAAILPKGPSSNERPFHRLDDGEMSEVSSPPVPSASTTFFTAAPTLTLDFPNEKSTGLMDSMQSPFADPGGSGSQAEEQATLVSPTRITMASRYSTGVYSYVTMDAPPAYTPGRDSAFIAAGDTTLARA